MVQQFQDNNIVNCKKEWTKYVNIKDNRFYLKDEHREKIKVAVTGGVFDIFHYGHLLTLKNAKKYGDILIVVIARDENVTKIKGKQPVHSQKQRQEMIQAIRYVDLAIIGKKDKKKTLDMIKPNVIVFGYDQEMFGNENYKTVKLDKEIKGIKSSSILREIIGKEI